MSGAPDARQRLPALINFSGAGRPRSCSTTSSNAQTQPGPLPFYLGLDLPTSNRRSGTPPVSLWTSPAFELNREVRLLCVSARFPLSLSSGEAQGTTARYRLREQILNDLIYTLHSHGARPGMISFRRG